MSNYDQVLASSDDSIQIDTKLFSAICNGVGENYEAAMLLLWLIGQEDGVSILDETVMKVFGISRNEYYAVRQQLENLGFITMSSEALKINYDAILKE